MPQQIVSAGHTAADAAAATVTMVAPISVSSMIVLGHTVSDWVLFGTLAQLLITLPYWCWRVRRDVRRARIEDAKP